MTTITVYPNNSGWIPLNGLMDLTLDPPVFVNNATQITATLYDPNNNPVSGLANVAGVYVSNTNGNYIFPVPDTFNPAPGPGYTLKISVTSPVSNAVALWTINTTVAVRTN